MSPGAEPSVSPESDTESASAASPEPFVLRRQDGRLSLFATRHPGYGGIYADWGSAEVRRRIAGGRRQLLARAVLLHKTPAPELFDATGGLGRDAYTFAALGARVTLSERQPLIAALLADAHARALADPACADAAARLEILPSAAQEVLDGSRLWDVIYLDPMYPEDGKAALPSKEMQFLRELTGGDVDAGDLLAPALRCARRRVVVKRPAKAPWLGGHKPQVSLEGTQLRLDLYLKP